VIQLTEPSFIFPPALSMQFAWVLPRDIARKYGPEFMYHLVGSGPYQVTQWERGVRWRLDRNPHYNGPDAWIDAFEIQVGGDRALTSMLVQRGELDRAQTDSIQAITFRKDPAYRSWLHTVPMVSVNYLFLNTELKPFDDVRVRRAVNHAVDRQRIVKLLGGLQDIATGIVPTSMPWSNPDLPQYPYDPAKARELLRQAGFPSGFKTELLYRLDGVGNEQMAQSIENDLKAVGIAVELKPLSMSAFFDKVQTRRQSPMGINSWTQDYPDPSNFLDILLNGDRITDAECQNCAFFNHAEFNRLMAEAGQSMDGARRTTLFRQAERKAMEEAPWVPLIFQRSAILRHPRVHGDEPDPVWLWRYERMWLDP
jgi:ABC-type transport system substrate-binding protein